MERHPLGRRLDRLLTPLFRLGGRLLARPDEDHLHALTGRSKGGGDGDRGPGFPALLASGREALDAGRFGEALVAFSRAAEQAPGDPWPWHGRGDAFQLSGDHDAALSAFDEALSRDPGLALSWSGRGNALEALGRVDEACDSWRRALELDAGLRWAREGLDRHAGG